MIDEFQRSDWFLPPQAWPQWMPSALWNRGLASRSSSQVPARIAFDWEEGPNGGLIGWPNPLWNRSNSYWWESINPRSAVSGNGGLLGGLPRPAGPPLFNPGPVNPDVAERPSSPLPNPSALPPIFPSTPPIGGWHASSPYWLKMAALHGMNSGMPALPLSQTDYDPFERAADRTKRSVQPEDGRQEGVTTYLLERYLPHAANHLATLPQRALAAADLFHRTGEYNPGPVLETALMMVGMPATPAGALGSSVGRGKGAKGQSLPMDEASRMSRSRQMGMSDERFYRGEREAPSGYAEPTYFTRDKEYADGIARRHGQPEAREFRLNLKNAFSDAMDVSAEQYGRLVSAAMKKDPQLAKNLAEMVAPKQDVKWLLGFARANPDYVVARNGGAALIRKAIEARRDPVGVFRRAGFDALDSGRDVLKLDGFGIRHKDAVFDPAKVDQRNIFRGIGAGAAVPFFGSGSLDAIPQEDLDAYWEAWRRGGDTL